MLLPILFLFKTKISDYFKYSRLLSMRSLFLSRGDDENGDTSIFY